MGDDRRRQPVVEPLSVARSVLQHEQQSGDLCAGQPSRSALAVRHHAGRAGHRQCRAGRAIPARHRLVQPVALCLYEQFRADRFADQVLGAGAMPRVRSSVLRVAAIGTLVVAASTSGAGAQQRVGVNSAVNPEARGVPPGAPPRQLVIGADVVFKEHITTSRQGQTQVLFLDKSAMTVGPNSDVTIDEFAYDPNTGTGKLAMSAAQGVMRFIGGRLSKNENAVTLTTPTGTLAVRGGIFLAAISSLGTDVTFLYGNGLTISNPFGMQILTRPGYMVTISSRNTPPSEPRPAPPGATAALLGQLDGRSGGTGGAQQTPTDQTVVSSGIATTISGNVMANVLTATQAAAQQQPTRSQPPTTNVSAVQTSGNVQSVQAQSDPVVVTAATNPTPAGAPVENQTSTPAFPLLPTDTVVPASVQSFIDQFNTILPPSLAAMPTVTLPTAGVGTYNGVAIGSVLNNGASYLAGGGFNQTYNFGTLTGTANITNFDGANYTAPLTGSGTIFSGNLAGPANRSGVIAGTFFGPSAAVTGGGFAVQNPAGTYIASGAFAGR